jgi:hypothetical protein
VRQPSDAAVEVIASSFFWLDHPIEGLLLVQPVRKLELRTSCLMKVCEVVSRIASRSSDVEPGLLPSNEHPGVGFTVE